MGASAPEPWSHQLAKKEQGPMGMQTRCKQSARWKQMQSRSNRTRMYVNFLLEGHCANQLLSLDKRKNSAPTSTYFVCNGERSSIQSSEDDASLDDDEDEDDADASHRTPFIPVAFQRVYVGHFMNTHRPTCDYFHVVSCVQKHVKVRGWSQNCSRPGWILHKTHLQVD